MKYLSRKEFLERRQKQLAVRNANREIARKMANTLCFNCYRRGHLRYDRCPNPGIIACSRCFQLNVFTRTCNCENPNYPFPGQTIRLAGRKKSPLIYIDVKICGFIFHALYNSTISTSRIDYHLANWLFDLQELTHDNVDRDVKRMVVPIQRRARTRNLECKIVKYLPRSIELGQDYIFEDGFTFIFDDLTLNHRSPVLDYPDQIDYVYNQKEIGEDLRKFLKKYHGDIKKPKLVTELYGHPKRKPRQTSPSTNAFEETEMIEIHPDGNIDDLEKM